MNIKDLIIKKGMVFEADLDGALGSEQRGSRPVLVIQNDIGNRFSPTVIVLPISAQIQKAKLPTHVEVRAGNVVERNSVVLGEQPRTLDKQRLSNYFGTLDDDTMQKVDVAMLKSIALDVDIDTLSEIIKMEKKLSKKRKIG